MSTQNENERRPASTPDDAHGDDRAPTYLINQQPALLDSQATCGHRQFRVGGWS